MRAVLMGGLGLFTLAHRPKWLDPAQYGWGAVVGGGGEEVNAYTMIQITDDFESTRAKVVRIVPFEK